MNVNMLFLARQQPISIGAFRVVLVPFIVLFCSISAVYTTFFYKKVVDKK